MNLRTELEHFRDEHGQILRFLNVWEGALKLATSADDEVRRRGLTQLREMEPELISIERHCREEERSVEAPFSLYLGAAEFERLKTQHETLGRWRNDFRTELAFASALQTDELVRMGRRLLETQRQHINYEERLLKQIQDESAAREIVAQ